MPNLKGLGTVEVQRFIEWLSGKEEDSNNAIAALATHVRAHQQSASGSSPPPRWPSIEAMKSNVRHYGPNCTEAQFDAAYAAFVAS